MKKFTKPKTGAAEPYTNRLKVPFSVCFKYKLQNGYTFEEMTVKHLKEWQNFLDIASQLTFEEAERRYRRVSDTADVYDGEQVIHYAVSKRFRIHGIIENGQFVILRMDPNHSVH